MALWLGNALLGIFGNKYIATLFVSMFPLIELKGAIPIGKGLFGLGLLSTAGLSYLGSTAAGVLVFFLLKPVFALLKKIRGVERLILKTEALFNRKAENIAKKTDGKAEDKAAIIKFFGLLVFVAVPFPVTGVWTGAAIAVFLNMKFYHALPALALGNLVAGAIITLLTFLFEPYVDIIIYTLFAIVIIMLVITIIKIVRSKPDDGEK
ncbi:MAG TPA: hypothetical protein DDW54_03205 [Clostridiales bacterium]|nr:hypothetical protein [Clostridiales bacterium]